MPLPSHSYSQIQITKLNTNSGILGIEEFIKSLELSFFSKVTLRNWSPREDEIAIALEMQCSFNLLEILGHFNKGLWGSNDIDVSPLKKSFTNLVNSNSNRIPIDIQELTLFLNDTTITIKKVYTNSIIENFDTIISEIGKRYVSLSMGLTEKPEEIFIPVFEDNIQTIASSTIPQNLQSETTQTTYYKYWGIYLESDLDGLIFDVQNNKFIPAKLDFCVLDD
ncbi:hypothetical protein J8L85_10840 [Maribacter sp. MMG018]|uniref:hypothetical protein n=1 Tax=Maribacter sp. MMG018 TaxID=2822688 RepID=UPI001B36D63A|nr:hypothetical protein [Maribacter sp. MMG018]MBQ4914936.1 hypothetical protein [Maribacter sp. MMG018]